MSGSGVRASGHGTSKGASLMRLFRLLRSLLMLTSVYHRFELAGFKVEAVGIRENGKAIDRVNSQFQLFASAWSLHLEMLILSLLQCTRASTRPRGWHEARADEVDDGLLHDASVAPPLRDWDLVD
jgi:hypothetical protein